MVPRRGLEPPRVLLHTVLSRARLPVSPPRRETLCSIRYWIIRVKEYLNWAFWQKKSERNPGEGKPSDLLGIIVNYYRIVNSRLIFFFLPAMEIFN